MTEMGLLARCNMADGTGYALALDPTNSTFNLIKLTSPTTSSTLVSHQISGLAISNGETFEIAFEVIGSTVTGKLFSSQGTLLDTITATDTTYTTGSIGIWALKNVDSIEGIWTDMGLSRAVTSIANSVNEGSPYTLDLSSNPKPNGNWTIDWGDGSDPDNDGIVGEIVAGSASSATHIYADGNKDYTITTTADIITEDAGALDPTFGDNGTGILNVDDRVIATGTQSDGKIIELLRFYDQPRFCNDYCLVRFTADGILDTSFGTNGKVVINYTLENDNGLNLPLKLENPRCLVVQSDDKILIGGSTYGISTDLDLALIRFNANGNLDASFGTNGFVKHDLSLFSVGDFSVHCSGINSTACNLALQSDGSIIVHGTKSRTMNGSLSQSVENVLTRYTDSGTLDNGFGINGLVSIGRDLDNSLPDASSFIEISSDDKILVMEHIKDNGTFHLVRYNADGSLDSGFGTGGKVATDFVICDVAVQSDGKIVTGGWASDDDNYIVSLVRYNTDGTLDTSFGIDGRSNTDVVARNYELMRSNAVDLSIAIQNNGQILVTGGLIYDVKEIPNSPYYLARYNADGSLDGFFGTNGITSTNIATGMNVSHGIIAEPDGHVLIIADTIYYSNGFRNVACAISRYLPGYSDICTISRMVTVNNVAPTITLSGASTAYEGNTYTLIMGSVVDPGQDTVTSYTIHWGDGTSTTYNTETPASHLSTGDAHLCCWLKQPNHHSGPSRRGRNI